MEDKELKKKLAKIPDVDKNGEPIFKIAGEKQSKKSGEREKEQSKK